MRLPIYLDNNATTRVDPRVLDQMLPYFSEIYGNAASKTHGFGWEALEAVDRARQEVAELLGARPSEIVFTSGATESNNLAILGTAHAWQSRGRHIISSRSEHPAILDPLTHLEKQGFRITRLRPDATGLVTAEVIGKAIESDTILISIMAANNEVGTLGPLREIGEIAAEHGILFHTDAAQAVGKIPMDVKQLQIDMLSLTAHKFYGPKGVGALYVRGEGSKGRIQPILFGGGHENGLRSGTLAVPLNVGLGAACRIASEDLEKDVEHSTTLADRLRAGLTESIDHIVFNGHPTERLPGTVHVSIPGLEAQTLLMSVPEVAISSGAACSSSSVKPSHVLKAIGVSEKLAVASLRFGIGRFNTLDDIEYAIERIPAKIEEILKRA